MRAVVKAAVLASLLLAGIASQPAAAAPVLGATLVYSGGLVTVTTLSASSGYVSELGIYDSTFTRLEFLAFDEPAGVSRTFDPRTLGFAVGDELIFGIRVLSDGGREYFTGAGGRNPDGIVHAFVDDVAGPTLVVGFEDLFGGGDRDYDDTLFSFEGGIGDVRRSVPEPAVLSLFALGLGGLAARRRRSS